MRKEFTFLSVLLVQKESILVFCYKQCTSLIVDKAHKNEGKKKVDSDTEITQELA